MANMDETKSTAPISVDNLDKTKSTEPSAKKLKLMKIHEQKPEVIIPGGFAITSFYCFKDVTDIEGKQPELLAFAKKHEVRGSILLATEGFNGSLSGFKENVDAVLQELYRVTETDEKDVIHKTNYCDQQPFGKVKVRLKQEIVPLKAGKIDVNSLKGEYVEPAKWAEFIHQDDVVTIDTRNDYEIRAGTFTGAINPNTDTFGEFPEWVDKNADLLKGKKIAMFCTGGIRCEKSTAFMKMKGYDDVYHLKGGILQYLDDTRNKEKAWEGECFVFDRRRRIQDDLTPKEGYWSAADEYDPEYVLEDLQAKSAISTTTVENSTENESKAVDEVKE